jgi:hypothetical protein
VQHLLSGPEPQRIILGLASAPDLRNEDIDSERDTGDEEKNVKRSTQRWPSEHEVFPRVKAAAAAVAFR